jgi:hypothetical protein
MIFSPSHNLKVQSPLRLFSDIGKCADSRQGLGGIIGVFCPARDRVTPFTRQLEPIYSLAVPYLQAYPEGVWVMRESTVQYST